MIRGGGRGRNGADAHGRRDKPGGNVWRKRWLLNRNTHTIFCIKWKTRGRDTDVSGPQAGSLGKRGRGSQAVGPTLHRRGIRSSSKSGKGAGVLHGPVDKRCCGPKLALSCPAERGPRPGGLGRRKGGNSGWLPRGRGPSNTGAPGLDAQECSVYFFTEPSCGQRGKPGGNPGYTWRDTGPGRMGSASKAWGKKRNPAHVDVAGRNKVMAGTWATRLAATGSSEGLFHILSCPHPSAKNTFCVEIPFESPRLGWRGPGPRSVGALWHPP